MAEAAVSFLLENLSQLLISQAELLIDSTEEISWIQTEFRVMLAFFQSIDALHQLSGSANDLVVQTRKVIKKTEGLIDTYVKQQSRLLRTSAFLRPVGSIKLRNLREKLRRMKDEIVHVRHGWKNVHYDTNIRYLPGSSYQHSESAAMEKLDSALQVQRRDPELRECIKWVRDELAPLYYFLREIHNVQVLGEGHKIWIQELKDLFQLINESFEKEGATKTQSFFLSRGPNNSGEVVSKIQDKILQLYRRYYAYWFGDILVNNGSRSIFPRIKMKIPIPAAPRSGLDLFLPVATCLPATEISSHRTITYLSLLTPGASLELLRVDLKLMKALLNDTRPMGDLDERAKVWRKQLQEIAVDLEALDEHANKEIAVDLEALDEHASKVSEGRKGAFHWLFGQREIDRKLKQIAHEIFAITARKMTYGIGSALGEAGMLNYIADIPFKDQPQEMPPYVPPILRRFLPLTEGFISKNELGRQVESVRKELELMQALFEDFNRMEKPDASLEIWVENMLRVASEANAVVEPDRKSICTRNHASWRIEQVYDHIFMVSKWKHTYDIGYVKSSRTSGLNHNLVEAAPFPSNAIEEGLELFKREIEFFRSLYGGIEEKDKLDGTAKAWIEEMHNLTTNATKWISGNAEHTYGGFATRILRCFATGILRCFVTGIFPRNSARIEQSSRLARLKDKIRQLSEIKIAYGIAPGRLPLSVVLDIKEKLLADQEQACIIPILGMRREHKEALQELINIDNAIQYHFGWHSWVRVPEELDGASILAFTVRQIMKQQRTNPLDVEAAPTEEALMQMLQEILVHERYLIVLDEIQSIDVWQRLAQGFPEISNGSRIILISNKHNWSLLNSSSMATFDPVKLGGLPSATREVMPGADAFNINSVPSYLRQCLYYFLLFPANFEVPTRRLIVLWAAEGLVRQNELESDEDVANRYLNELMELNIVHGKAKKLNGKYKACQLNEDIRDTLSTRAKDSRFFQDTPEKLSRLVDHHGTSDSCFIHIHGNPVASSLKNYRKVLSFMSFNTQEGNKPGEDLGNFLHKCISAGCFLDMRVLDLEKVFRPKLPEAICDLIFLRYLGLRWTYLEHLPKSVHKLLNLQVLDVKHTYISILPRSIWKMQYLRHLYLSETYRTKFVAHPSEVSLDKLQTLWGAFIDEETYVKNGLDTAHNIRKLGLLCRSSSSSSQPSPMPGQLKVVDEWISELEHLEILRLKSLDEHGKASKLHLNPLRNQKLSTVYLLGKLDPKVVSEFPENLVDITLSGSDLNVDPMISLEKLQQLRILRLLSQSLSEKCKSMRCSRGGFPELKVLKIWKLEYLEEWEVEEGALPSLEELEIRSCEKLKMLPDLQHVATLQECMLTIMPEKFIDETKTGQPALWPKIKLHPNAVQEQL